MQMAQSKKPWMLPVVITAFSIFCNYILVYFTCPDIIDDKDWTVECMNDIYYYQYAKVYCRVGPYLAGMYAGYYHSTGKKIDN